MYWKPRGIWTARRILCSAPSCHYQWHAELIMLCDHLMWHWPLTWPVACLPPSPPSLFIRQIWQTPGSELCGPSLLCNRSRLHCDTCQRGRKWRSDSLNYLCGNPPLPPFLFLPEINLLLNLSLHRGACSGHSPHEGASDGSRDKAAIWQRNSDFKKLKDDSRGQIGMRELLRQWCQER